MRITFIVENYPPDASVSGLRMQEMAKIFSQQEHIKIVVYNPFQKTSGPQASHHENIEVVRYRRKLLPKILYSVESFNPFVFFNLLLITLIECIRHRPDLVITTVPNMIPAAAIYMTSKFSGVPYCVDIRDNWITKKMGSYVLSDYKLNILLKLFFSTMYELIHRLFIRSCKNAMLVSVVYPEIAADLKIIDGYKTPTIVIPNGINEEELNDIKAKTNKGGIFKKYGIPQRDDEKIIVYTGWVGRYYHPEILIKPLKILVEKGYKVRYVIAGSGSKIQAIADQINRENLGGNVTMTGNINHADALQLLLSSDIALYTLSEDFPSPECALGTKILEYIACDLPIICITGQKSLVRDIVINNKWGIALTWDSIDALEGSLMELLETDTYRKNVHQNGPKFLENYSRMKNSKKLYMMIREAMKTH